MADRKRTKKNNKSVINSYSRHYIDQSDIDSVVRVLKSPFLTQGHTIAEFEKTLANYCGSKYAVVVNSGTSALHLSYIVAGLKDGDEVITTPNTFVATSNMILTVGAKPVFCDIRLDTRNIDETKIEELITKKTKAIVPVHFAGQPSEMDSVIRIAKKHKLKVIEDACHALGAEYKNKKIGSLKSDMTVFSFHPVKSIATGEGGAILTNNKKYYERLLRLRSHGIEKNKKGYNSMIEMGYNYRMTDIQASLGISQLKKIDVFLKKRRRLAHLYLKELSNEKNVILPVEIKETLSSWHIFVIQVREPKHRDKLIDFLKGKGVGTNIHYPNVYSHDFYRRNGYKNLRLKDADFYSKTCITLPLHFLLKNDDIRYISNLIKEFFTYVKK